MAAEERRAARMRDRVSKARAGYLQRHGGAVALRSFTGPLVLFLRVLGARWVPVGAGPSDAPALLEAGTKL